MLAATFVVLGVLPIVFLAELGFTVAFGVLLDTIVVRSILVPALSYDIGKRIWWPSKLAAAGARTERLRGGGCPAGSPRRRRSAVRFDEVGARVVLLGDRLDELGAAVEHPDAVVGGVAGGQRAVGDE